MELLTKGEYAYRRLHDDILSGKLPAGSRLVVKDLVEEYEVSSMPIRNAITRLEELGLVHTSAHQGAWVSEMNLENYFTFMLLRIEAEALAATFAAQKRDDSLIQKLEVLYQRMEAAREIQDYEAYGRANRKSHILVCAASGNSALIEQINNLMSRTQMAVSLFNLESSKDSCLEHRDWIEALRNRDAKRSAAIVRYQRCRANLGLIYAMKDDSSDIQGNQLLMQAASTEAGKRCLDEFIPIFLDIKAHNDYRNF